MTTKTHTIKLSGKDHGHKEVRIYEDEDGDVTIDFGTPKFPDSGQKIWLNCRCGVEETIEWLKTNLQNISYRWE